MRHIVSFALALALTFGPARVAVAEAPRISVADHAGDDLTLALAITATIAALGGLVVMYVGLTYFDLHDARHAPSTDGAQTAEALIASGALSLCVGIVLGVIAVVLDLDARASPQGLEVRF